MKKIFTNTKTRELSDLLDSDDEFPDSYDEVSDTPAYLTDVRFEQPDPVKFEWIHKKKTPQTKQAKPTVVEKEQTAKKNTATKPTNSNPVGVDSVSKEKDSKYGNVKKEKKKILLSNGILSMRDIFFINCIKQSTPEATLLWFAGFLKYKSQQPFPRSCLAWDITDNYFVMKETVVSNYTRYYTQLLIY